MPKYKKVSDIALLLIIAIKLSTEAVSAWDFAVTSKTKIIFYDEHWNEVTTSTHRFDQLSALTFDESEEVIYFNDLLHNNGSIFSLQIPISSFDQHIIDKVVQRTLNESIRGIAFDPLKRNIYWTDALQRKIFFAPVDMTVAGYGEQPQTLLDFANEESIPDGLALDICRRTLYWTNSNFKNATIERINLNGSERKVIVKTNLHLPHGIFVDQLSDRIYWVVDQEGVHFSVESAELDGSNRTIIVQGLNNVPLSLAVTKDTIYWTDITHNAVWSHPKFVKKANSSEEETPAIVETPPKKIISFLESVGGIVARTGFYQTLENDKHCASVVSKVKQRLLTPKVTRSPVDKEIMKMRRDYCLNGGDYVPDNNICICKGGFRGLRCEENECHNYCVHGTCALSAMSFPKCYCQEGFYGKRCELDKCADYCYNEGLCRIDGNGEPSCECKDNFGGHRCEHNSTEICALYCRILKYEPETYAPFGCHDICEDLALHTEDGAQTYGIPQYTHLDVCRSPHIWTSNVIMMFIGGVVACFALIALTVHGLRRIYKPARPRIKKTFVVRKQARTNSSSDTPLTNRPIATEQCEITIENCCNMNICETPCFDPKLVEQTLSSRDTKVCVKEDKKILIHNMEDEFY